MIVYSSLNKINGKRYIGITTRTLLQRISEHRSDTRGDKVFSKALHKYGLQSFEFNILDTASSKEELIEKEKYWIKFYASKGPNGYNLTDGGEGTPGILRSEEHKRKLSEANMGKKNGPPSEETRKKMSDSHKGIPRSEETKEAISRGKKGSHPTEVTRKRMSIAKMGNHYKKLFAQEQANKEIVKSE